MLQSGFFLMEASLSAFQLTVDMVSTSTNKLNRHMHTALHRSSQPSGGSRELEKKE